MNNYLVVSTSTVCSVILRLPFLIKLEFKLETVEVGEKPLRANLGVRCNSTCKLAFIWTKQTNPYNQGYIYVGQDQAIRTKKDIYVVKR